MKRTPMKAGKPLERKSYAAPARKPIKPRRETERRRTRGPQHEGQLPWAEVRLVIFARSHGRCEGCGAPMTVASMEGHHRRTRRVGPDCPCNALALCASCHHGPTVHGGPELAMELGRIVSRHTDTPPYDEPVELHGVGRVLLDCSGGFTRVPDAG